jgi:hypothetical protein
VNATNLNLIVAIVSVITALITLTMILLDRKSFKNFEGTFKTFRKRVNESLKWLRDDHLYVRGRVDKLYDHLIEEKMSNVSSNNVQTNGTPINPYRHGEIQNSFTVTVNNTPIDPNQ